MTKINSMPKEKVQLVKELLEIVLKDRVDVQSLDTFLHRITVSLVVYSKLAKRISFIFVFMNIADLSYLPYCSILIIALLSWDHIILLVKHLSIQKAISYLTALKSFAAFDNELCCSKFAFGCCSLQNNDIHCN